MVGGREGEGREDEKMEMEGVEGNDLILTVTCKYFGIINKQ